MAYPALKGYRVVDFGSAFAGPQMAHLLADMGAEVIKVESHVRVDLIRFTRQMYRSLVKEGIPGEQEIELSPSFHSMNRGKLGITVDYTKPKGVALIKELVKISDMACDNYTPGVLERRGLGYESLREVKPDIVMVSLSFAGQTGPLQNSRGYANVISAISGTDSLVGYCPEEPVEGGMRFPYSDHVGAMYGIIAILAALVHRNRTGEGQFVDVSEWETSTSLIGEAIMDYTMNERVQKPQGNHHPTMAPHGFYPCKGEAKWVSIAVKTDEEWHDFCQVLGNPPWTKEEKFAYSYDRLLNQDELDMLIGEWTANHTPQEVTEILQRAGVAAAPLLTVGELYEHPHYRERHSYVEAEHPLAGPQTLYDTPWRLSESPARVHRSGPLLGEHNEYLFRELLGMSAEDFSQLQEEKIIY